VPNFALPRSSKTSLKPVLASGIPSFYCDRITTDSPNLLCARESFAAHFRWDQVTLVVPLCMRTIPC